MPHLDYVAALKPERASFGRPREALTREELAWLETHSPGAWRVEKRGSHVTRTQAKAGAGADRWIVLLPDKDRAAAFRSFHASQPAKTPPCADPATDT